MNILVTGGAGYIGSHTVQTLLKSSHRVFVFDNLSTGFFEAVPAGTPFILGDVRNTKLLIETIQQNQISAIFHFAAKLNVLESVYQPLPYHHCNVLGMMSLLEACRQTEISHFLFSSTSSVYGDSIHPFLDENSAKNPKNPYGYSKLIAEKLLQSHCEKNKMSYLILRYFNAAGAATDLSNGQRTMHPYHLIHLAAQAAIGLRQQVQIHGSDYSTPDGTCIRDYIHIEDLADLHHLCFEQLLKDQTSRVYNCGYGQGFSVKEVLETIQSLAPHRFQITKGPRRPGDPAHLVASAEYLHSVINWAPQRHDLKKIGQSAIDWEIRLQRGLPSAKNYINVK